MSEKCRPTHHQQAQRQAAESSVAAPARPERLPLSEIAPRSTLETRPAHAATVVEFAECIETLGLLQPLVVDTRSRLLAGAHRYAALRLLAVKDPEERVAVADELLPGMLGDKAGAALAERIRALDRRAFGRHFRKGVPVLRYPVDAAAEPTAALAVEVAENEKRIDYTPAQIRAIYDRLVATGAFHTGPGRPRNWKEPAWLAVSRIVGKSRATVKRLIDAEPQRNRSENCPLTVSNETVKGHMSKRFKRVLRTVTSWSKDVSDSEGRESVDKVTVRNWRSALARAALGDALSPHNADGGRPAPRNPANP